MSAFDHDRSGGPPRPGERDPRALRPTTVHTIRIGGPPISDETVARLNDRWPGLIAIEHEPAAPAGVTPARPDGHVGFRTRRHWPRPTPTSPAT